MPNTKSAAKRLKSSAKQRLVNQMRKSRLKTSERRLTEALAAGDREKAQEALNRCFSELDKAAKKGAIHRNKADRKKDRLSARLGQLS